MDNTTRWHNANLENSENGKTVLLRVEKDKNPNNVQFIVGYYSGYEYCDKKVLITHYDRVTHWIELPE
jgi:hypothetical protein